MKITIFFLVAEYQERFLGWVVWLRSQILEVLIAPSSRELANALKTDYCHLFVWVKKSMHHMNHLITPCL